MQISVRTGDTLWNYSVLFDIPYQLIVDSNPNIDANQLQVGQLVEIPGYIWSEYNIMNGDSLWSIAKKNGISVHLLTQSNPSVEANDLQVGQVIMLPKRVTDKVIVTNKYYTYEQLRNDLDTLKSIYPFIEMHSIGDSVMGKPIPEVVIGKGSNHVHVNAAMHANEWITTGALMNFINEYLLSLTNSDPLKGVNVYPIYLQNRLSTVPMVNPDGVNLVNLGLPAEEPFRSNAYRINGQSMDFSGWKANINGVDLNKQFPALWEVDAVQGPQYPAPRDFSGSAPLTEPEVIALANLTRQSNFNLVIALHTQGEEIYWGFQNLEPPESEQYAENMSRVSGYRAVRNVNSTAGYKDWFIQDWRRPGFTIELGLGVNPLPLSQFETIADETTRIILVGMQ